MKKLDLIEPGNIFEIPTNNGDTYHLVFKSHSEVILVERESKKYDVKSLTSYGKDDELSFVIQTKNGEWFSL